MKNCLQHQRESLRARWGKKLLAPLLPMLLFLLILATSSSADEVSIWDQDTKSWTTTFSGGDPIDTGVTIDDIGADVEGPPVIDSKGMVYVAFPQNGHIYLTRYNGTDVRIWDNDTKSWTATLANGDPIDPGLADEYDNPDLAVDSNDVVYITYDSYGAGAVDGGYLNRFDGTDVRVWDNDAKIWTATFANGDPVNKGSGCHISIASGNMVLAYTSLDQGLYLSRYNGTDVQIWDNNTKSWTSNIADGDPINNGSPAGFCEGSRVTELNGALYFSFTQSGHAYLGRCNGTDVRLWDNNAKTWTSNFADADPLDTGVASDDIGNPAIIASNGMLYIAYAQHDGGTAYHIYLACYNGMDIRMWDNDTKNWTTTFADKDPIGIGNNAELLGDSKGILYVVGALDDPDYNMNVYFSRYDGTDVRIWDKDTSSWSSVVANGDSFTGSSISFFKLVMDPNDYLYISYSKAYSETPDGDICQVYLSRYDGTGFKVWDRGASAWTSTFANGDPIDTGVTFSAGLPCVASDPNGIIYTVFEQNDHIYLTRYLPDPPTDTDRDGHPDNADAFPADPDEWLDTDADGSGNNADPDDDNDTMPDAWESLYPGYLDPLANDAAADADGDGSTNLSEYAAGTNPSSKTSYPGKSKAMPWIPLLLLDE